MKYIHSINLFYIFIFIFTVTVVPIIHIFLRYLILKQHLSLDLVLN